MKKSLATIGIVLSFAISSDASARCATPDMIQFATNMIWCWQTQDHTVTQVQVNGVSGRVGLTINIGSYNHQYYVDSFEEAVKNEDWREVQKLYAQCQSHQVGRRILDYVNMCNQDQARKAIEHAISCYRPVPGGTRIQNGQEGWKVGQPWHESKVVGACRQDF